MRPGRQVPYDELALLVGTVVVGEPFSVTAQEIRDFERVTWVDQVYEDADPDFPADIVEGFFALSLVDPVVRMTAPFDYTTCWGVNYGLDRVRFVSPMYAEQQIVPTVETLEVREKGNGLLISRRVTFTIDGASTPGMVADWSVFMLPRGASLS